jgi:hypothetical protein
VTGSDERSLAVGQGLARTETVCGGKPDLMSGGSQLVVLVKVLVTSGQYPKRLVEQTSETMISTRVSS